MQEIIPVDHLGGDISPMVWTDNYKLGYEPMDDIHEEFVELLGQMQIASDDQLIAFMDRLIAHTKAHFEEENQWMIQTEFPPKDCHIEQHEQVMASMLEVRELLEQDREDRFNICRNLVAALVDWFDGHATHLDSALAHWMFKRQFGGKPVVIHKKINK